MKRLPHLGARWLNLAFQTLVVGVVAYYLCRMVADNWGRLRVDPWQWQWGTLGLSVLLGAGATLGFAACWALSLRMLAAPLPLGPAVRLWMVTNFLKYVPGKVWLLIARFVACERQGVRRSLFLTSFVYEFFLLIVGGVLAAMVTLPFWSPRTKPGHYGWTLLLSLGILAGLHPRWFNGLADWALQRLGREPLSQRFQWGQVLQLTFLFAGFWLLYGLGFACMAQGMLPVKGEDYPALIGFFSLSFAISQIALITPGGLGVREGVLVLLLAQQFPHNPGIGALLAIASRLWSLLAEGVALLVALPIPWRQEGRSPP